MLDVTLSLLALIAGGFTIELFAAGRAPLGTSDGRGLLIGEARHAGEDSQSGNPS